MSLSFCKAGGKGHYYAQRWLVWSYSMLLKLYQGEQEKWYHKGQTFNQKQQCLVMTVKYQQILDANFRMHVMFIRMHVMFIRRSIACFLIRLSRFAKCILVVHPGIKGIVYHRNHLHSNGICTSNTLRRFSVVVPYLLHGVRFHGVT